MKLRIYEKKKLQILQMPQINEKFKTGTQKPEIRRPQHVTVLQRQSTYAPSIVIVNNHIWVKTNMKLYLNQIIILK